jgi:hypothetical protein
MVTKRNDVQLPRRSEGHPAIPPPELRAPPHQKEVERQLAILFGQSLFGTWSDLSFSVRRRDRAIRKSGWLVRTVAFVAVIGIVLLGWALVQPGMERVSSDDRAHYAEQLGAFVADGDWEHSAPLVDRVRGENKFLDALDVHRDLLVHAEVALYRYFDADPKRLDGIRPHIQGNTEALLSAPRRLASFAVLSREERAAHLPAMERMRSELPRDTELLYLIATAHEFRGETEAAREAYNRSAGLGPTWVSQRFEQALFERHQGKAEAASKVAIQLIHANSDSSWSPLAAAIFNIHSEPLGADAAVAMPSPVQIFHAKLLQAVAVWKNHSENEARQYLTAAVTAVNAQEPFLLDAFDYLLQEQATVLARTLTLQPTWPRDSAIAAAKQERLAKASQNR